MIFIYDALHFDSWSPKIDCEADARARGPKVIQSLRQVDIIECLRRLEFDGEQVFDKQVRYIESDHIALIIDVDCLLLLDPESDPSQLVSQRVLINFFQESATKNI